MLILLAAAAAAAATPALKPAKPAVTQAEHSARGRKCAALADKEPEKAIAEASAWKDAGGGMAAMQCAGLAFSTQGRWADAAASFEAAAKDALLDNNAMTVVLWMQAGNAALAGDEPARAKGSFDRALLIPGLSNEMAGEVHLDRARAAVAANDMAGAKIDLAQATKLVPRDPLGWLLRANLARKMADLPLAFSSIREAAALSPDDASILYEAGNIAAASGNMEDAKSAWTKAAQAAPTSSAGQAAALALKGGDASSQ